MRQIYSSSIDQNSCSISDSFTITLYSKTWIQTFISNDVLNLCIPIWKQLYFTARPGRKSSSGTPITPDSARSTGRSRSRIGSIGGSGAVSQPGSRSTSPSSIKSYHTYFDAAGQVCTKEHAQRNEISLDLEFRRSVANFVFCNCQSWWHWISTQETMMLILKVFCKCWTYFCYQYHDGVLKIS